MITAGLAVTGTKVTAWAADADGSQRTAASRDLPSVRPRPDRWELDPARWEQICRSALGEVAAGLPEGDWLGVTVSAPPGFVLVDRRGEPLGHAVLGADRRGAPYVHRLAATYPVTGQPPRADLALAALLAVQAEEPERWAATSRVLLLHDWLVVRMTGVHAAEASGVCSAGMADVVRRSWAAELLQDNGIRGSQLAPVIESGTLVGELLPGWGLPPTLPVVAGCGVAQLAAMGAGGLADGVLSVVATPPVSVLASTGVPVLDPLERLPLSTHAVPGFWALAAGGAETSAVDELERALGRRASAVLVGDRPTAAQLARALGREVHVAAVGAGTAAAGTVLVARAVGAHAHVPRLPASTVPPPA